MFFIVCYYYLHFIVLLLSVFFCFQAEDGIRYAHYLLEFRRVLFRSPTDPDQLRDHVTLTMSEDEVRQRWELQGSDGEVRRIDLKPRVSGFDFPMLMALAKQGLGITMLPETLCAEAVRAGELEVVQIGRAQV